LLAAGRKPNIVLVIARGWRGLSTPWVGDPDIVAPRLITFAKEAIVFPRAYAAYPHPSPARAAIASGRYPHTTGTIADGAAIPKSEVTLESSLREAGYRTGQQIGAALDFIKASSDAPFFLSIILEPPHFAADSARPHVRENVPADLAEKTAEELRHRYGNYSAFDEQFGRILTGLDASNTIVVFTSDAGEQVGSHGLEGDDSFYEESARVPLAIRAPGLRPAVSDLLVSHVDVMPTLLGLCVEPRVDGVQGRDLSPFLTTGQGDRPESVFAEGRIGQKDEWRMLVLGSDKLVTDAAGEVTYLFNLAADPYELTNLAHAPSAQLKRAQLLATIRVMRSRLLDFRRR
jgi:arylsulfatase A-like enzyme